MFSTNEQALRAQYLLQSRYPGVSSFNFLILNN